jgi:hypothetical protein
VFCPKCGDVLSEDPDIGCLRGGMPLSAALNEELVACFQAGTRKPSTRPLPFPIGGSWYCPGCGVSVLESQPGNLRCDRCHRCLNEFIRALVELHPHTAPAGNLAPPPGSRLLLVVEDTFQIAGRGLIVVPGPSADRYKPGPLRVELRRPDGTRSEANGRLEFSFVSPPPKLAPPLACVLLGLTKRDVPLGTQVWVLAPTPGAAG